MALSVHIRPAVFLDKDGTLVRDIPYNVDPTLLDFTPGASAALNLLSQEGYALVVVTNQPGLALGKFDRRAWERLRHGLFERVRGELGVELDDIRACPHPPASEYASRCACRKPGSGLLRQAAALHHLDLTRSWMVGDILDDVEAGRRAGCRALLMDVGNETVWRTGPFRAPERHVKDLLEAAQWIVKHRPHPPGRADHDVRRACAAVPP